MAFAATADTCRSLSSQTIASNLRRLALCSENHSCCVYSKMGRRNKKLAELGSSLRISIMLFAYIFTYSQARTVFLMIHTTVRRALDFWPLDVIFENVFSARRDATLAAATIKKSHVCSIKGKLENIKSPCECQRRCGMLSMDSVCPRLCTRQLPNQAIVQRFNTQDGFCLSPRPITRNYHSRMQTFVS